MKRSLPARASVAPPAPPRAARRGSGLRLLVESIVCLALTVTLIRGFALEGYMISTGSMAPCLLGYHRRVTCPSCGLVFARGLPVHEVPHATSGSLAAQTARAAVSDPQEETATCPNCGARGLRVSGLPRNEGDQLLVHKHAYGFRELLGRGGPRRWEVVVFRNPQDPTQAYVKRVVGLPGERIEIEYGDVYSDGRLRRKPYEAQLGVRVLVDDADHPAGDEDPDREPRWLPEYDDSGWTIEQGEFSFQKSEVGSQSSGVRETSPRGGAFQPRQMDWVVYRHWVCAGGTQRTAVRLAQWPAGIDPPDPLRSPLDYDTEQGLLSCVGALPAHVLERWLAASDDEAFQAAVRRLHRESHVAPISDVNAYNSGEAGLETHRVRDLMVEFALHWRSGQGTFVVEMTDGDRVFDAVFDFGSGELVLYADGEPQPVRRVKRPAVSAHDEALIQVSTFDSQVVVAVDGTPLCEPCEYERGPIRDRVLRRPVRFGARDVDVHIRHVRLFRDVYYTPGPEPAKTSYAVGRGEYLVLGDNSRVSIDSRHWDRPGVPEELLIGKPLAVHLPSKSGALRWGERTWRVRIPDISRMRYIR